MNRYPSTTTLTVHEERVALLMTRLERLALDDGGLEALHEARELLTILQGWAAAARGGLASGAPAETDRATVYRRINALSDTVTRVETGLRERLDEEA